ncbi:MAG: YoaP domain-containing protein [Candidatus Bathyarchaeum tardum]|nr:MAG: YoaP domain-containing protein [Candidatus Bathyarchaeum tardum]
MGVKLIDITLDNVCEYGVCGYKNIKNKGLQRKVEWLKARFSEGLKIKSMLTESDGTQGLIEYIPGEYCWRPVQAKGYMFIHCIFSGFKKMYKGQGYGSLLIDECIKDAKQQRMTGVAVVTRKSGWMADNRIFFKKGFKVVDSAAPDYNLLAKKFNADAPDPKFNGTWEQNLNRYSEGLTIIWSGQCPYPSKYVEELAETAEKEFNIFPNVVELKTCKDAQNSPCPFGVFCVTYNGKVVAGTPISKRRLSNILKKELKQK